MTSVNFYHKKNRFFLLLAVFLLLSSPKSYTESYQTRFAMCAFDARLTTFQNNKEHKRIFIETGTHGGGGIIKALLCGFDMMYSCELSPLQYAIASERLYGIPNVFLYNGDSFSFLTRLLPLINEAVFFWLDAHYSNSDTAKTRDLSDPNKLINCPLMQELQAIATHKVKTHTILIDDIRLLGTAEFDYLSLEDVIETIKTINPDYCISFEDGYVPGDVLVAKVSN